MSATPLIAERKHECYANHFIQKRQLLQEFYEIMSQTPVKISTI